MSTQKEIISRLTCEVLRLRLRNAHLSITVKKSALVERLLQHEDSLQQGTSGLANAASDDSSENSESETPSSGDEVPSSSAAVGTGSVPESRDTATNLASTTRHSRCKQASDTPPVVARRVRLRRHASRSCSRQIRCHAKGKSKAVDSKSSTASRSLARAEPRVSGTITTRSSSSSDSSSSDSSSSRSRSRRRHKRRRHSKRHHQDHSPLGAPFTTFTNAPPRKEARRIRNSKYIAFDKLLPPLDDQSLPALIGKGKIDKTQRLVSDLPSWLEAWNKFVAIRVQTFPDTALAMLQYQSTICQLFSTFGPVAALKYNKLFRQAVARAKDQTLR